MSMYDDHKHVQMALGGAGAVSVPPAVANSFVEMANNLPIGLYTLLLRPNSIMPELIFMNSTYFEITGLNEANILEDFSEVFSCVHPADYERILKQNIYSFTHKVALRDECRLVVDGRIRWIFVESRPREAEGGSWIWDGVIKDITDQKISEEALKRAREKLVQATAEKARMVAREELLRDIHDGFGNTLAIGKVRLRKNCSASLASQVIEDCLDDLNILVNSIDSDGESLWSVLCSVAERSRARAQQLGQHLTFDIDAAREVYLLPRQMLQVGRIVQEAISNAIRHSEAKVIHVAVMAGMKECEAMITIKDDGKGLVLPDFEKKGRGLKNMRQRAEIENWSLEFGSAQDGKGTLVVLEIGKLPG